MANDVRRERVAGITLLLGVLALYGALVLWLDDSRVSRSLISAVLVMVAALWGAVNARWGGFLRQTLGAKPRWVSIVTFTLIAFALVRFAGYGFAAVLPAQAQALRHDVVSWPFLVFYFAVSIPLQEFVFRGYTLMALERWTKSWFAAVIVSSTIYSFFHLHYSWKLALAVFPLGLLFAAIKIRTRSLAHAILAHAIVALVFYYLL